MSYRSCWAGPGNANGAAQWPTRLQRSLGHQLRALNHFGVFNEDIGEQYGDFPRWHNPFDEAAPIQSGRQLREPDEAQWEFTV